MVEAGAGRAEARLLPGAPPGARAPLGGSPSLQQARSAVASQVREAVASSVGGLARQLSRDGRAGGGGGAGSAGLDEAVEAAVEDLQTRLEANLDALSDALESEIGHQRSHLVMMQESIDTLKATVGKALPELKEATEREKRVRAGEARQLREWSADAIAEHARTMDNLRARVEALEKATHGRGRSMSVSGAPQPATWLSGLTLPFLSSCLPTRDVLLRVPPGGDVKAVVTPIAPGASIGPPEVLAPPQAVSAAPADALPVSTATSGEGEIQPAED